MEHRNKDWLCEQSFLARNLQSHRSIRFCRVSSVVKLPIPSSRTYFRRKNPLAPCPHRNLPSHFSCGSLSVAGLLAKRRGRRDRATRRSPPPGSSRSTQSRLQNLTGLRQRVASELPARHSFEEWRWNREAPWGRFPAAVRRDLQNRLDCDVAKMACNLHCSRNRSFHRLPEPANYPQSLGASATRRPPRLPFAPIAARVPSTPDPALCRFRNSDSRWAADIRNAAPDASRPRGKRYRPRVARRWLPL